jgi:hypothetical protein
MLEDSGLIKESGQALGATGLRSVRWKHIYTCILRRTLLFFGNKRGSHHSMCPYHMCLQRPLDMEVRE